ncbi:hypothetical protein AB0D34_39755 [Streptomyces sp. NPDC048420]|uniref:hypothetical protein n=1 Tax=Streptomyces sp. NPDC048420 TaxID=3155755 RepID=UPI00342E929A
MTSDIARPRWWSALRGFLIFFVSGGLGSFAYAVVRHRPVAGMPWGGLLFGAIVCATLSAVLPAHRRR